MSANQQIINFRYESRPWQWEALAGLTQHTFSVIVAHRRAGKTELMVLRMLLAAMNMKREHPAPLFAYIAPFLNQAKKVAWERLKFYARILPGVKINESELTLSLWNGATIRLFGADYPDRLRGQGYDGVVMDEVAQMRPETWPAVVRPALVDHKGWAAFIGTPKGINAFYDYYTTASKDPKWFLGVYPADKTGVIDAETLGDLKKEMGEQLFRQELLCDFTADNSNTFIDYMAVDEAMKRKEIVGGNNMAPLVFGLDVARFGDDRTVLLKRRGRVLESFTIWQGQDLMKTASLTAEAINLHHPRAVFVDVIGIGAGVVDRLKQLGHRVIGVNAGKKASKDQQFVNLKAEMWHKMRDWISETAVLPDREDLRNDLLAPSYDFDGNGRLKIESKDDLKSRRLASTDIADALALTFAQPVAAVDVATRRFQYAEMD